MKRILSLLVFCLSLSVYAQKAEMEQPMLETMRPGDKAAVVVVHTNKSDAATSQWCTRFDEHIRGVLPTCAFFEASIARSMENPLPSPDQLLDQLAKDGYTHVLMQSSCITEDDDMLYLRLVVDENKGAFKHLRLGEPLLSNQADYETVARAATDIAGQSKETCVLVCKGIEGEANAPYALLGYIMQSKVAPTWQVATIGGFPSQESLIQMLQVQKNKKVRLIAFSPDMLTAVATEWVKQLGKAGIKATTDPNSLLNQEAIFSLFAQHARHAEQFRRLNPKELKLMR